MFGWEFPPHNSGGLGVACKGIVDSLCSKGTKVTFVLPKKVPLDSTTKNVVFADKGGNDMFSTRGVDVLLMPYATSESYTEQLSQLDKEGKRKMKKVRSSGYANSLVEEVYRYGELAEDLAEEEEHDVIHAHDWLSFEAGIAAKRASGKPLVAHIHATEFDRCGDSVNQLVYDIERRGLHAADSVVAVSNLTKDIVVQKYGVPESKITVVHNGIREADYSEVLEESPASVVSRLKDHGYKIVLFVGRITFQKGPDYFVRMAKEVRSHEPNTFFVVCGSGDMETQMIREVAAANMSDRFIFTGFLRGNDLNTVYKAADIYIMPSVSEPFGLTPLEAMIQNTPVLISRQSGVSEVVNHALKADFWDIDDMTNKVVTIIRNPSLYQCLRANGKNEVSNVNWCSATDKLVSLYRQLAEG